MTEEKVLECGNGNIGFEEADSTVEDQEFKEALENYKVESIKTDKVYNGVLIDKDQKYFIFDINNKSSVYVPRNINEEMTLNDIEYGQEIDLYITSIVDNKEFFIYGSAYKLILDNLYDTLNDCVIEKEVLTGTPVEMNHAGYTLNVNVNDQNINLFMPHLLTDVNKLPDPQSIIGEEISFILKKITKDGQTQYIVSRKDYLKTLLKKEFKALYKNQQCLGIVTGTTSFGVFVQFNTCLTAMIHKSNLSEEGKEYFNKGQIKPGMQMPFLIKSFDFKSKKVFGTQIMTESLWDKVEAGDTLTGKINNIKPFGLLIELDYETKGLIHKSNMKNKQYHIGDDVEVKVTNVNKSNRQITLNFA